MDDPRPIQGAERPAGEWLAVYGTLKRNHPNHHWLGGARCHGEVRFDSLVLHDLGPFPMAVPGSGTLIAELYHLDPATLARLDHFEGVPRLYRRWRYRSTDRRWLWVYLGAARQVRHSPRLEDGCWRGCRPRRRKDGGRSAAPALDQ